MSSFSEHLSQFSQLFVLTGAGISLSSGIPTYRDDKGKWTGSQPIQHADFIREPTVRQRYWARSLVGWRNFGKAQPNAAHAALAEIERLGRVALVVTQNVDRLHQRAGSQAVVDLHGRLDQVICLSCGELSERSALQRRLEADNHGFDVQASQLRPDGDADVPDALIAQMRVPACLSCGGVLKPHVVFFGDNVPKQRVHACQQALRQADAMLVIGSSLQVYSGYRFCRQAAQQGTPLLCINPGQTRADELIDLKTGQSAEHVLAEWVQKLVSVG
ncbi:MAG: NAD-dependent protein deacetylase [Granulosicoccaceae bacterium]